MKSNNLPPIKAGKAFISHKIKDHKMQPLPKAKQIWANKSKCEKMIDEWKSNPTITDRKTAITELLIIDQVIQPKQSVIDLGCGPGRFYEFIKQNDCTYLGVDSSVHMLTADKKDFAYIQDNILEPTSFAKDKHFDVAMLLHVTRHYPNPLAVIKRVIEVWNADRFIFTIMTHPKRLIKKPQFTAIQESLLNLDSPEIIYQQSDPFSCNGSVSKMGISQYHMVVTKDWIN